MTTAGGLLTLALGRCPWQLAVTRWADTGLLHHDVVAVVSIPHALAHLNGSRRFTALVLDASVLDDELITACDRASCPVIAVTQASATLEYRLAGHLVEPFGPDELATLLQRVGRPLRVQDGLPSWVTPPSELAAGAVVTVIGGSGSGTSTAAQAIAQHFGQRARCALLDWSRHADLGTLHGAVTLGPGLAELAATTDPPDCRPFLHYVAWANYDLLLGLRRPTDWSVISQAAIERSLAALQRDYDRVVCDVDAELDGEAETGSYDVAERHGLSRLAVNRAAVVVLTTRATLAGARRLMWIIGQIEELGSPPNMVVCVTSLRTRSERRHARAEISELVGPQTEVVCWDHFEADRAHRARRGLPAAPVARLGRAVENAVNAACCDRREPHTDAAVAIGLGELEHWADQ